MKTPTSQPGAAEQAREFSSWLWPDRVIGKRESRQLREEHNRLVNSSAALVAAIDGILACVDRPGGTIRTISADAIIAARKAREGVR